MYVCFLVPHRHSRRSMNWPLFQTALKDCNHSVAADFSAIIAALQPQSEDLIIEVVPITFAPLVLDNPVEPDLAMKIDGILNATELESINLHR